MRQWIIEMVRSVALASNIFLAVAVPLSQTRTNQAGGPLLLTRQDDSSWPCTPIFEESNTNLFDAGQVHDCLQTVPFSSEVAIQFLQYYREAVVFQSSLMYLRNPPSSYQQPAVDIMSRLDDIESRITNGEYTYEYEFESALQSLAHDMHDHNVWLDAGAMRVFTFGSSFAISSVSCDGTELPQPYVSEDLINTQAGNLTWSASPMVTINGEDAVGYLAAFADKHAWGQLDPHADWNSLMWSPAANIQYYATPFTGETPFYPGEWLNVTFANGSEINTRWLSIANIPDDVPLIQSGLDFYYYFVLGLYPSDLGTGSDGSKKLMKRTSKSDTRLFKKQNNPGIYQDPQSWEQATGYAGFPGDPVVVQNQLGQGGLITGYHLENRVAVLSIPDFLSTAGDPDVFPNTVAQFIQQSQNAGMEKIIIDLQQNYGSEEDLALRVFQQFFPNIRPYRGSRMRVSEQLQAMGETFTQYWSANRTSFNSTYESIFADLPWAVLDKINAETGSNFTSFGEYYGPNEDNGDQFSTVELSPIAELSGPVPFSPDNIVILTDAICHAACAAFVEMMHHYAGVRTITVGGRPNKGAMQAVGGTRGAYELDTHDLDVDMWVAAIFNDTANSTLPSTHVNFDDLNIWLTKATLNLKDRVRGSDDEGPLQFAYEPANCRIYWTPSTFNNFGNLWAQVANITWAGAGGCVEGSAQHTNYTTDMTGPTAAQKQSWGGHFAVDAQSNDTSTADAAQNLDSRDASPLITPRRIETSPDFLRARSPAPAIPFSTFPLKPRQGNNGDSSNREPYPPLPSDSSFPVPAAAISAAPSRQFVTPPRWPLQPPSIIGMRCPINEIPPQARNLQCVPLRECEAGGPPRETGFYLLRCEIQCSPGFVCRPVPNYQNPGATIGSNPCPGRTEGVLPLVCLGPKYCYPNARPDATCQNPPTFDPLLDSGPNRFGQVGTSG